jgi:Holliday junction resolvasome RuvABC endonuclease subunit
MKKMNQKYLRVLAIALSTRGLGFAVFDGQEFVNWGEKRVEAAKNAGSLAKVEKLIADHQPEVIVLEDASAKDSQRAPRIRVLSNKVIALAASRNVRVELFSHEQVKQVFFSTGKGTKHAIAEMIANRFSEELGFLLPPKRKLYTSEDARMAIFDAAALALTFRLWNRK